MTDEMRLSLVAIATARGLTPAQAWDVVDGVRWQERPLRQLVDEVDRAAVAALYPGGAVD